MGSKINIRYLFAIITLIVCSVSLASATLVSVSHVGYHPDSTKYVIAYTSDTSGTFTIYSTAGVAQTTLPLEVQTNFFGANVTCQGGNACLVGDFSSFTQEGDYYIVVNDSNSSNFTIDEDIYEDTTEVLLEFFNAQMLQGSAYHADMHSNYDPIYPAIADGSFIMEADQATKSLIRMGSAYRRNPTILAHDNYDMRMTDTPDIIEYIDAYVSYLASIQGLEIEERTDDVGFRLSTAMKVQNAFVPGPTNLTNLTYYTPGQTPTPIETVPVWSLCGTDDGSAAWDQCIDDALFYYKCQIDEPCLNITYEEASGVVISQDNGFGVAKGWGYEFGCYNDITLLDPQFAGVYNPCLVFYTEEHRKYTAQALYGFLLALPAYEHQQSAKYDEILARSINTYYHIENEFSAFSAFDEDIGYWGAALFLLYDHTGDVSYLQQAQSLNESVSRSFVSDATRGNEYYWEEYKLHQADLQANSLEDEYSGNDPAEAFRGKMWWDYKDKGPNAISNNGERVFQFDNNIQFQNSRYMLTEAVFASKSSGWFSESFMPEIADSQFAWLTGANGVQDGVSLGSPLRSINFIYGTSDDSFPEEFHSRWLVHSGFINESNGTIIGARGTGLMMLYDGEFEFLDGKFTILGQELGALGNTFKDEVAKDPFIKGQTFANGKTFIPGWINGAFDINNGVETDKIFNYDDNLDTYEFTETTNEIVSTAIELMVFLDGKYNENVGLTATKKTSTVTIVTQPGAIVSVSGQANQTANASGIVVFTNLVPDQYTLSSTKTNYYTNQVLQTLVNNTTVHLPLVQANGTLNITSNPTGATIKVNDVVVGTAPLLLEQIPGAHTVHVELFGYQANETNVTVLPLTTTAVDLTLYPQNNTCYENLDTIPIDCTGTVVMDVFDGTCRSMICEDGIETISVLACNKPDSFSPDFFEMYKQSGSANPPELCLANVCVQHNGYAKSSDYPVCLFNNETMPPMNETNETNQTNTTMPPVNGTCFETIADASVSCLGGSVISDVMGGCRSVVCESGSSSLEVMACDKPGSFEPTHFEMFAVSQSGSGLAICFGDTCLDPAATGYVISDPYPLCQANETNETLPLFTIAIDSLAPPGDVVLSVDILANAQALFSTSFPPGVSKLFHEVDALDIAEYITVAVYQAEAVVIVGDDASSADKAFADDVEDILTTLSVPFTSIDSSTVTSSDLIDLFMNETNGTNETCFESVAFGTASCLGGSIVSDVMGGCRTITCEQDSNSLAVMACDKPGSFEPTHFEMFTISQSGSGLTVCIGGTCLDPAITGYVVSDPYPLCSINGSMPPPMNETNNTNETNQTYGNATITIAPWFPQGLNVIFSCQANDFNATHYDWIFGDGTQQVGYTATDIWHTYPAPGNYTAQCIAHDASESAQGLLAVELFDT